LLHCMDDADFWILPGGQVEFGELSSDTASHRIVVEWCRSRRQVIRRPIAECVTRTPD
jgi:hypothetical protein